MNDKIIYTDDGIAVDTILLKSLPQNLEEDQIFDYFSSFGKIHSVIHINAIDSLGFVKFNRPKAAAKALKLKHHMIAGHLIGVKIAQNWSPYQPTMNDVLPRESTTATQFMDLKDDCIREIFGRLHVKDLCSLRESSESNTSRNSRLDAIIDDIFTRKYKICDLNTIVSTEDEAQRLLTNFGPLILELSMESFKLSRYEMKASGLFDILDRFPIKNCYFERVASALSTHYEKVVFSNLKKLSVRNCCFEGHLFTHCSTLLQLTVTHDHYRSVPINDSILQYTFPALETFREDGIWNDENLKNFILRHKKLKTVKLRSTDEDQSVLIPIIAASCTELKELRISTDGKENPNEYEIAVTSIASFSHLDHLTIQNDKNPLMFIRQLRHLYSLKELYLTYTHSSPDIVSALSQLKMLERLVFCICNNISDFNSLANLYRLKDLTIMTVSDVSFECFDLENAVRHLPDLEVLFILRTDYKIDEVIHSKIVNARSRAGSDRHSLLICLEGVEHHFSSK